MSEKRAVEVRHDERVHRADSMETLVEWAREHRLDRGDCYRPAGTDQWLEVTSVDEIDRLLDPDNWWTLKMGGKTFTAPDWETVVTWTREGRLTEDVQIEGPKTPPGGILGKASPELAPYLREPVPEEPEVIPPRIRFDGRTYLPGDLETVRDWIRESRIPLEAEISIDNDEWQPLPECGHFELDLWPTEALEATSGSSEPSMEEHGDEPAPDPEPGKAVTPSDEPDTEETTGEARVNESSDEAVIDLQSVIGEGAGEETDEVEPYRITTTFGEDSQLSQPREILGLLRKKKLHGFDKVSHPDLPEGSMFVNEFIEVMNLRRGSRMLLFIIAAVLLVGGGALLLFNSHGEWMLYTGIVAAAAGAALLSWGAWKN